MGFWGILFLYFITNYLGKQKEGKSCSSFSFLLNVIAYWRSKKLKAKKIVPVFFSLSYTLIQCLSLNSLLLFPMLIFPIYPASLRSLIRPPHWAILGWCLFHYHRLLPTVPLHQQRKWGADWAFPPWSMAFWCSCEHLLIVHLKLMGYSYDDILD